MSLQPLIDELLGPKRVSGQEIPRPPTSLELRAAKAIYLLFIQNKKLNEKLISQSNDPGTNPGGPAESQTSPTGCADSGEPLQP